MKRTCLRLAMFLAAMHGCSVASTAQTFNQEAPIAPYGVPVSPSQTESDKAAIDKDNPVAPLPPPPPQPAPPQFQTKTPRPR